jgi:hypothetical protein
MSDDQPKHSPTASSPYPMSRLSAKHNLIDVAREIQAADSALTAVAFGKLEQIARQIRALQEEAQRTLDETRFHAELHRAACSFKKVPGHIYHLYRRGEDNSKGAADVSSGHRRHRAHDPQRLDRVPGPRPDSTESRKYRGCE